MAGFFFSQILWDAVTVMCNNPVSHKAGRYADIHNAVVKSSRSQRFQPALKCGVADFRLQLAANLSLSVLYGIALKIACSAISSPHSVFVMFFGPDVSDITVGNFVFPTLISGHPDRYFNVNPVRSFNIKLPVPGLRSFI